MIKSIQKIIKVGTSAAVTIPSKEMKRHKLGYGDEVQVTIEVKKSPDPQKKLIDEYGDFIKQYGQTLKNLAKR